MLKLLQQLCELDGVSGNEDAVRDFIRAQVEPFADSIMEDAMGNLLIYKKGRRYSGQTLMLDAHMDEVGLIITHITDEGFLKFGTSGGINPNVLLGTRVRIGDVKGIIGLRAVHMNTKEERKVLPPVKSMYIDIGANSREEAEKLVSPGDYVAFDTQTVFYGDMMKAKAIDDRIGCAVLIKLIQGETPADAWYSFTVQEEQGARGAAAAAFRICPDVVITLEGTTACDLPGLAPHMQVCHAGQGPVLPIMDNGTLYDPVLWKKAMAVAAQKEIAVQTKSYVAGGTDAGRITKSGVGAKALGIAAPVRYIHTPSSAVAVSDVEPMLTLVRALMEVI